jgi:aspartyl-tRNA(Asn)/glutamyl-tRNA(Gln) amidotransferase subunit A
MTDVAPLHELTAVEAVGLLRRRAVAAAELVEALLARIAATEPDLRAWVLVDAEGARRQAAERDRHTAGSPGELPPLHGLPVGVKDIIDVQGLPTRAGFEPFAARTAQQDAAVVAALRSAGAIVLGKTETTQFAVRDPAPTRNPWHRERTPGGSSSGSGAAVAARQVPAALGSQTSGSTLRPASYNGIVGFKPTFDWVPTDGVTPLCWSLDHVGLLARRVGDAEVLWRTAASDPGPSTRGPRAAPRLGLVTPALDGAAAPLTAHLRDVAARLEAQGASVRPVDLPLELAQSVQQVTMQTEAAAVHHHLLRRHADAYGPLLRAFLEVGEQLPGWAYLHAQRLRRRLAGEVRAASEGLDALLLPTAPGPPPGLESTGNASLLAPFTLLGLPAISLPSGLDRDGLPIGVQLAGRRDEDADLLAVAAWCEERLGWLASPAEPPEPREPRPPDAPQPCPPT